MEIKIFHENEFIYEKNNMIINIITEDRLDEVLENNFKYPAELLSMLKKARNISEFTGNLGDIIILYPSASTSSGDKIYMFAGLGKRDKLTPRVFQNCGAIISKRFSNFHVCEAVLDLSANTHIDPLCTIKPLLEGIAIGAYTFSKYFTKKTPFPLGKMHIIIHESIDKESAQESVREASINISASNIARHLTNEASNNKTPDKFANLIHEIIKHPVFNIKTLDYDTLKDEGLNLLCAVGQAGSELPKLCIIEYIKDDSLPFIGIVGKAVTFDSGGLMIKSKDSLPHMREDVGGAASLIGVMSVVPKLDLNFNIIAAVPIAENLIDSNSYRPSDIIVTKGNISVEISNTDAEGRLMLADSFLYLQEYYKLSAIIDIATLTGAITRALGKKIAGFFTNNIYFEEVFKRAYERSLEKFWQMPLEEEYMHDLKSPFADIKNDGGSGPKAICAAIFLSFFIKNNLPWLHLDVGSSISPGSNDILYGCHDYANGMPSITIIELFRIINSSAGIFDEASR